MDEFPLQPFLQVWTERELSRRDHVPLTLRDCRRISMLLRSGGEWTLLRLRNSLMSLLTRSPQQQEDFLRCFNDFFRHEDEFPNLKIDLDRALSELHAFAERQSITTHTHRDEEPVTDTWQPLVDESNRGGQFRRYKRALLITLVMISVGLIALSGWVGWTMVQTVDLPPVAFDLLPPLPSRPDTRPVAQELQAVSRAFQTLSADVNYRDTFVVSPLLWLPALLLYGVYERRRRKRATTVAAQPSRWDASKSLHFRAGQIGGKPAPFLSQPQLDEIASQLGYCQENNSWRRFDAKASANATLRRHVLSLIFRPDRRLWRLYILEDKLSDASRWHTAARELAKAMEARGLTVEHLIFRGVPSRFQTADGINVEWQEIEEERDGAALLFFSDSQALEPADEPLLRSLLDWPMCAWMELREQGEWDASTARVSHAGVPVYPATAAGIARAIAGFADRRPDNQKVASGRAAVYQVGGTIRPADVEYWLGDAFRWAQACAMMQPITHGLADALRRQFQPHVPPECWGRLLSLPDTYVSADGVKFSDEMLAVLRQAFSKRWSEAQQEEILRFIMDEVSKVEPPDPDSPEHMIWEWTLERVRLELAPDEALPRLKALEGTPLGRAIRADLENIVLPGTTLPLTAGGSGRPLLPLRRRPKKKESLQQLASIAELIQAPEIDIRPAQLTFYRLRSGALYTKWIDIENRGNRVECQVKVDPPWMSCTPEQFTLGEGAAARGGGKRPRGLAGLRQRLVSAIGTRRNRQKVAITVLGVGEDRSHVALIADGEVFIIPVTVHVRSSWREAVATYWRSGAIAQTAARLALTVAVAGISSFVLTYAALPPNWVNRLRNSPPQLKSLSARIRGMRSNTAQPLVTRAEAIEIRASAEDPEGGTLRYEWQLEGAPLKSDSAQVSLKPAQDIFQVTLRLHDADGGMSVFRDEFTVLLQPSGAQPPTGAAKGNDPTGQVSLKPGEVRTVMLPNDASLRLVYVPSGKALIGSPSTEEGHYTDERQRVVSIGYGFFMSEMEVTQEQWEAVMHSNPSYFQHCPTCPVERVSQNDLKEFIKRLNHFQNEYVFRLPSESEWEYAARAGTDTVFAFGNTLSSLQANFDGEHPYGTAPKGNNVAKTTPVGSYPPNAWGLYDMHGNVAEWCEDIYQESYDGLPADGSANVRFGDPNSRVLRGGSWLNYGISLRSADRNWVPLPSAQNFNVGGRLVAAPVTTERP